MARSADKPQYPRKRAAAKLREAIRRAQRAVVEYTRLGLPEKSAAAQAEVDRLVEDSTRRRALARLSPKAPKRAAAARERERRRRVDQAQVGHGRVVRGTKLPGGWRLCPCGTAHDMTKAARVECRCGRTLISGDNAAKE